jgi:hypothetical protein
LPEHVQKQMHFRVTNEIKAQHYATVFAGAVAITLHDLNQPDSTVLSGFVSAYRLSKAVDSVVVRPYSLRVYGRRSLIPFLEVEKPHLEKRPGSRREFASSMNELISDWARALRSGYLLRIMHVGGHMVAPDGARVDGAIAALQRGRPLSPEDSAALQRVEPNILNWKSIVHPERLEPVRR